MPQEQIKKITSSNDFRSPFYEQGNKKEKIPFARLTIEKKMNRGSECPYGKIVNNKLPQMDPTEFDPNDYSDPVRRFVVNIK